MHIVECQHEYSQQTFGRLVTSRVNKDKETPSLKYVIKCRQHINLLHDNFHVPIRSLRAV